MAHDWLNIAIGILAGAIGWLIKHHVRRLEALEKRVDDVEAVNQAVAIKHLSAQEVAILYRPTNKVRN